MNLKKTNISIIGLGDSGYWSAKLASLLGANVFVSDSKENINKNKNIFICRRIYPEAGYLHRPEKGRTSPIEVRRGISSGPLLPNTE